MTMNQALTKEKLSRPLTLFMALVCLLVPVVSAPIALLLGIVVAVLVGNSLIDLTKKLTPRLLGFSIMGLGAGMDLAVVAKAGLQGIWYTIFGIGLTMTTGLLLAKALRTEKESSILISVGTAICGGSAIAAVAPAMNAKQHSISIALGTVFILNALALVIFPFIGHALGLTEVQFGLWSALAIHDTSSVVGATLQYGPEAVQVGTSVKLARALWILPVTLVFSYLYANNQEGGKKAKFPWFVLGFVFMAAVFTYFPALHDVGGLIEYAARRCLVLTLFFIGTNLTPATIRTVGIKSFLLGFSLWILVASITLGAILHGFIH
ncbi:MAG: putative sulfate exporter family transporter [Micavibrio sp.]|nr:putative sulfate exporter family transporter [Micavibrio sp.]